MYNKIEKGDRAVIEELNRPQESSCTVSGIPITTTLQLHFFLYFINYMLFNNL